MLNNFSICLITVAVFEAAKLFVGREFSHGVAAGVIYCATIMAIRDRRAALAKQEGTDAE